MALTSQSPKGENTYQDQKPRRHWVGIFLTLLFILVLVGGAFYLVQRAKLQPAGTLAMAGGPGRALFGRGGGASGPSVTVGQAHALKGQMPIVIDALGTITSPRSATIVPQVSGILSQVLFNEGQMVQKGQILARIDPRPYQQAFAQAQGQLQRDQAQLSAAQVLLSRYQRLLDQDSIARQDFDTQNALYKQLQGTVRSDQAALNSAKINLDFSVISAPFSGLIGFRNVDAGNFVSTGTTGGIATLTQIDPIDVIFSVPQERIPDVQTAAHAGPLPVLAMDSSRSQKLADGLFLTLDNQVNVATGTVRAKARFDNKGGELFPNQFVNVRLEIGSITGLLVPVTAVRTGPNGDYVYTIDSDNVAHMQPVKRGLANDTHILIVNGLQEGQKIVSEGGDRVKDGSAVRTSDSLALNPGSGPAGSASGARGSRRHARSAASAGASAASSSDASALQQNPSTSPPPSTSPSDSASSQVPASSDAGKDISHGPRANLTDEQREKLRYMSPEERRSFFRKLRAEHQNGIAPDGKASESLSGAAAQKP